MRFKLYKTNTLIVWECNYLITGIYEINNMEFDMFLDGIKSLANAIDLLEKLINQKNK